MQSQKNKLDPKTFRCKRCGECCKLYTIKLTKADIKRIEKRYNKDHFLSYDHVKNYSILKNNNKCVFLKMSETRRVSEHAQKSSKKISDRKKNKYFCNIYDIRPKICQKYPFFRKNIESCKPVTMKSFLNKR